MERRTSSGAVISHPHLVRSPYHSPTLPALHSQSAGRDTERRHTGPDSSLRPRGAGSRSRERSRSSSHSRDTAFRPGPSSPAVRSQVGPPQALVSPFSTGPSPDALFRPAGTPVPVGSRYSAERVAYGAAPREGYPPRDNFIPGQRYGPQHYGPTPPDSRKPSLGEEPRELNSRKSSNDLGKRVKTIFKDMFKRDLDDHDNGQQIRSQDHWSDDW